jgi:hypothetical protein
MQQLLIRTLVKPFVVIPACPESFFSVGLQMLLTGKIPDKSAVSLADKPE